MDTISEQLKKAIAESGLSQRQLGIESGVCRVSILRWLNGKQTLTLDAVDKLCAYFGLALAPVKTKRTRKRDK